MHVRHVFQVLRGVISGFYVLFPGSMLNHRPVCISSSIIVLFLLKTYIVVHVRTSEAVLASTQNLYFRAKKWKIMLTVFKF